MAKKKKAKNKNKKNISPAVAPKAKFSASEKKEAEVNKVKKSAEKATQAKESTVNTLPKVKPNKKKIIVAISVFAVIIAVVALLVVLLGEKIPETAVTEYLGQNATSSIVSDITVDEETQLERYEEIRRKIKGDKKAFKFYAHPSVEIDEKYLEGTIMFSNLTMNDCTMIVTLMDENDDIIFRSMGIAPGKCMQRIGLTKSLGFGQHDVKMYVTAYNSDTFEVIGTQYMNLDLMIGSEYSASEDAEFSTQETTTNPNVTKPVEATKATQATVATTKPIVTQTTTTKKTTVKNTQNKTANTTKATTSQNALQNQKGVSVE